MIKIYQNYEPLPGYRVLEKIGSGGFGEVWKCSVPGGLLKAIKFVSGKLGEKSDIRAEQEWKAIDRIKIIRHPFILTMERIDIIENCLVIVMELADKNLGDRYQECKQEKLHGIPKNEVLHYLSESAEALDLINSKYQLQHLDIKPQNLFLVHNHLKIGDFGLVHDLTIADQEFQGGITPIYSAPELIEGRPSRFSDQYSLAIVYQEMTTGRKPFESDNLRKIIQKHLNDSPDLSSLEEKEKSIVARALQKKPEYRFKTCTDFINALKAVHLPKTLQPPEQNVIFPEQTIIYNKEIKDQQSENQDLTKTLSFKNTIEEPRYVENIYKENQNIINSENRLGSLIIGIGKTGIGGTAFFNATRENLEKTTGTILPVKILGIDMDYQGISDDKLTSKIKLTSNDSIVLNLNRPNYYLANKEKSEKLGQWLPLSKLYQIPKSLCTEGNRILGKLALLDAPEKLFDKLVKILNEINQIAFSNTMPGKMSPNILTHTSGGASGALLDICKLITEACIQLDLKPPTINLILALPAKENCNIQMATNTTTLLQELEDKEVVKRIGKIILVESEINDKDYNLSLMQNMGSVAYANELKIHYQGSEINKNYNQETIEKSLYKTANAQLDNLSNNYNQQLFTHKVSLQLLKSWIHKKNYYDQNFNDWVSHELNKNNISIENLTINLNETLELELGKSVDSFIFKNLLDPLFILEVDLKIKEITSNLISKITIDILKNSEQYFGYQWYSNDKCTANGSFFKVMAKKTLELTDIFGLLLDSCVVQWIEKPGCRFGVAEIILTTILNKIADLHSQVITNQKKHISNLKVDLLRLNNAIQQPSDNKTGQNQSIQKVTGRVKSLLKTQIEILQCDCILSFLQIIIVQINDHMKELEICKTKLNEISKRMLGHSETSSNKLEDVLISSIENALSDTELQSLDEMIQEIIVKDFETFTQIFIGNDKLLIEFEKVILSSVFTYLNNIGKLININILNSFEDLSAKINFIKSHIASVQHKNPLHSHIAPNQTIFTFPRSVLGEWNSIQIFGPKNQSIFLVPGNDDFISSVCEESIDCLNLPLILKPFFEILKLQQNNISDMQSN